MSQKYLEDVIADLEGLALSTDRLPRALATNQDIATLADAIRTVAEHVLRQDEYALEQSERA